jgi:RHS repeat-associated protein
MLSVNNEGTPNLPTTIMSYSYDNVGNVRSMTDTINVSLGVATTREYDALNRLTVNAQGNKRVDYTYNAISQVTNKKRYSDITGTNLVAETNHIYDSINRLTNITHSKGATTIASYTQTYDAGSKITSITSTDGNSTFNYDDTDQLTGADYNYQTDENYTYDANGNRTNTGYVTGINNRLLEDTKYRYEYDKVGNRTKRTDKSTNEVTEYSWDIRDRLTGIRVINDLGEVIRTANYVYDVYDQRIAKIVDLDGDGLEAATTERFVYGSNQNIALVFDGNGTLTHRYMFSNGIDQIEADEQLAIGTTLWALTDHLGSVRDVVDNSGAVQNHIVYDAFGNITSQTNSSVIFRNSYTGQEFDSESGLFSYGGRYYDPFNGKFIQEDKIGFEGGDTNLSRYVFNSPVIYNDPSGNIAQAVVIPAAVIIGGALILLDSINRAIEVNQRGSRTIPLVPTLDPPPIRKPDTTPTPSPQPEEERRKAPPDPNKCKCIERELDYHKGGDPASKGSKYATYVSGSKGDYFIQSPDGRSAYFDGLVRPKGALYKQNKSNITINKHVIEAKAWNWGAYSSSLQKLTSTILINSVIHDQIVAKQCRYKYSVVISSPSLYKEVKNYIAADLYVVPFKWGNNPDT